ncbi:MAG: DUF559 domain-containing protein [Tomitella sp.]|nr:DUF559 domain-containing protein [Tomitella sp.]
MDGFLDTRTPVIGCGPPVENVLGLASSLGTLVDVGGLDGPFLASTSGLTEHQLRKFDRLHRDVCIARSVPRDAYVRARAAWLYSGGAGTLSGYSAAAVHGARFVNNDAPAELIRPRTGSRRSSGALLVRNEDLPFDEVLRVAGMRVTSPARTAFDLGRMRDGEEAVIVLDALFAATGLALDDVMEIAAGHPRVGGLPRLRRVLQLIDGGAESPQETRTRLLIIRHGLPPPQTQVRVRDEYGRIFARVDLGWPWWKVAVEYDGAWHWERKNQRCNDIERHEILTNLGWRVVRVTADQLRYLSASVIGRIEQQLRAAGAPV